MPPRTTLRRRPAGHRIARRIHLEAYDGVLLKEDVDSARGLYACRVRLVDWLRGRPPWRIDAVLAGCFVVTAVMTDPPGAGYRHRDVLALALILAATVPYFARRLAPLPVFAVSVAAGAALVARGNASGAVPMAIAVGAYTIGAYRPMRELVTAAAFLNFALVAMLLAGNPSFGFAEYLTTVAVFSATMLAGWTMQSRRIRIEALEREHVEASRRAAADERLRIAQELHDVVAHSLGVIAVQAGVGLHLINDDPAEARRALEHISAASRSSLGEIRRVLGWVRSGDPVSHAPMPGLGDLQRLAAEVAEAGLPVTIQMCEQAGSVPPGVGLAAYRIVQEALTNTLRHAGASRASVRLEASDGVLRIGVYDDGTARDGGQARGGHELRGHGLVGMRERVVVYSGSLEAGPGPGGGFRVDATIPYDSRERP